MKHSYIVSYTLCLCPHLALVFSLQGFNKVLQTERFPHQDCDSLEANHQLQLQPLTTDK